MDKLGDRIKAARKKAGLNQTQLAKRIDVPMTTLANWEQNKNKPKKPYIAMLMQILGPDIAPEVFPDGAQDVWDNLAATKATVQVLGYVGAGGEVSPIDDHAMGAGLEEVECPPGAPQGTVAVIVRGDSMYPLLNDGSVIYFSKRDKDIESHFHRLIIAHFLDGRKAVKGLTPGSKTGCFTLTSTNKSPMVDIELESVSPIDWIKPH